MFDGVPIRNLNQWGTRAGTEVAQASADTRRQSTTATDITSVAG